ncbi:hypothetical protein IRZ71_18555 [Flavobacterium sp. ANB]|uniref:ligand-binding sensor domain-containing protein n=1 Tax=unclassified Flavobacterium TaxID=196869 RepID=UPI00188B5DEF|nr:MULTISPECIES: two-component regulator propeller domain-containing protein [unclassified Flavobacterium]MBF4518362.1 hypothetical protein [Flavobacterium sp. ANB]
MKIKFLTLFIICFFFKLSAQNIFPVKLENCKTDRFCLDCGDIKAAYNEEKFSKLESRLNESLNLNKISGAVKFQVLVDSKGNGCVLSHNDTSNSFITSKIVKELNDFDDWIPAISNDKKEEKVSITLVFVIKDGKITGRIERVDLKSFKKSFDAPQKPEIYNTSYVYKNDNLKNYNIKFWNKSNSNLSTGSSDHLAINKNDNVWYEVNEELFFYDGVKFKNSEQDIIPVGKYFAYFDMAVDNENTYWVSTTKGILSFKDGKWKYHLPAEIGIDGCYHIINNPKSGEVFFCADEGLMILKDGNWKILNQKNLPELPVNEVYYAKKDSKNRLWIGTFKGSLLIDENGKVTEFEKTKSILKGRCITSMTEDAKGNLYFGLYKNDKGTEMNSDEGIGVLSINGVWTKYTTENSGIPANHTSNMLYDNKENILWITSSSCGLIRFDPINNVWENYNNSNSNIPTSYIEDIDQDSKGNIFLATRYGMVKIEKK